MTITEKDVKFMAQMFAIMSDGKDIGDQARTMLRDIRSRMTEPERAGSIGAILDIMLNEKAGGK